LETFIIFFFNESSIIKQALYNYIIREIFPESFFLNKKPSAKAKGLNLQMAPPVGDTKNSKLNILNSYYIKNIMLDKIIIFNLKIYIADTNLKSA